MGIGFWVRRFLLVLVCAFVIIASSHVLRGRTYANAAMEGSLWSVVTATIFTAARIYHSRRGHACAICADTPQTLPPDR